MGGGGVNNGSAVSGCALSVLLDLPCQGVGAGGDSPNSGNRNTSSGATRGWSKFRGPEYLFRGYISNKHRKKQYILLSMQR
jgi:hypothetical protein